MKTTTFLAAILACLPLGVLAGPLAAQDIPGEGLGLEGPKLTIDKVSFDRESVRSGEILLLKIEASLAPNWHVYGAKEPAGLISSLSVDENSPIELLGYTLLPDGKRHEIAGEPSFWVENTVTFLQWARVRDGQLPGPTEITGRLDYMVCNPATCLPEAELEFTGNLTIEFGEARPLICKKLAVIEAEADRKPVRAGEVVGIDVKAGVFPGWHVYGAGEDVGTKPKVVLAKDSKFEIEGEPRLPLGKPHKTGDETSYWLENEFRFKQFVRVPKDAKPGKLELTGKITYLPCDPSSCDPNDSVPITVPVEVEPGKAVYTVAPVTTNSDPTGLGSKSLIAFLLLAIGGGLFALVMPCTYPMIPITISFFTKMAHDRGGKVGSLAIAYGVGIVSIFVLIGLIVGPAIVTFATHPITNLVIGVVFVIFAMSLFGFINLQPPRFLLNAAGKAGNRGGYLGVFLMGATLVITSFTCSAPFVGSILAFGANQGSLWRVALGMGVFGLTMAVPFVYLALVPGKIANLPKSGEWMNTLKVFLGFVELAAALKFFSNMELALEWYVLPIPLFLGLWGVIFLAGAGYLFAMFGSTKHKIIPPWQRLAGTFAILVAAYSIWGAFGGRLDAYVMTPLAPPNARFFTDDPARHTVVRDDLDKAVALAKEKHKALLINFTGIT